ncbi:hypothetical protein FSP39_004893 [Pinctada imbricata]|uniref:CABIT domain-containing protein n=1 Tax=Pinctada imbricata TaxID=66713 RepID=A0AA88XWC2_PINIB|nr:hypothetical protein FSP39_004893 [Pinctada imbricata]
MTETSWSDETYTIRQLAMKDCFPVVVRVTEGYLPRDAEAFSQGDLIKLDFKKTYQKVAARFLDAQSHVDVEGNMHPGGDLMIPLGYKGIIKMLHKMKSYRSVRELLNDFPRFASVEKPIMVIRCPNKEKMELRHGVIELDREIPGEGLVCRYENKDIVIRIDQEGQFSSVPDYSDYMLKDIIERFPLPKNVQFIDTQFQATATEDLDEAIENIKKFKGCLKLLRVVHQEVIVGHYKPLVDTEESKSGQFCRRALALLPLDNKVVNEIEVQIPVYSDNDDYEFLVAKNFSEKVDMEEIEGSLYLEFSNVPRIHKFEKQFAIISSAEAPPPRPPKPAQISHAQNRQFRKSETEVIQNQDKTETKANKQKPPPHEKKRTPDMRVRSGAQEEIVIMFYTQTFRLTSSRLTDDDKGNEPTDDYEHIYDTPATLPLVGKAGKEARQMAKPAPKPTGNMVYILEKSYEEIVLAWKFLDFILSITSPEFFIDQNKFASFLFRTVSQYLVTCSSTAAFKSGLKLVHSELLRRTSKPSPASSHKPTNDKLRHHNVYSCYLPSKKQLEKAEDSDSEPDECYDYPDLKEMKVYEKCHSDPHKSDRATLSSPPTPTSSTPREKQVKVKPVAQVSPLNSNQDDTNRDISKPFHMMSVEELVQCLKQCSLDSLADRCKAENIDGLFLSEIPISDIEDMLSVSLSRLQIKKVEMIKEGWRPKSDH